MTIEDHTQNVKSLARSFKYAFRGVFYCIRNERNMRIHLVVAAYVLVFSVFYNFSAAEYAIVLFAIGTVFATEALNTAVEVIVNLQTQCYDSLARVAKDVAAGAVFISALFAAAIGCIFFIKPDILAYIFTFMITRPVYGILLLISIPVAVIFIFRFPLQTGSASQLSVRLRKNKI